MVRSHKPKLLTIGIPIKNEESNIPELIKAIDSLIREIEKRETLVEVIVNENASTDNSLKLLMSWQQTNKKVQIVSLQRPFSYQASILSMMRRSKGDAFVIIHGDLQDPPELILTFLSHWAKGNNIVAGVIESRKENLKSQFGRILFYRALKTTSDEHLVAGFQDFYLISRSVLEELINLPTEGLFLRGHISSRFGSIVQVPYKRRQRLSGQSNFSFVQKYTLALDGLLLFGTRFIRILSVSSFILFSLSILTAGFLLVTNIFGYTFPVKGWASLALLFCLLISVLGLLVGLTLEYLIRIYRVLVLNREEYTR